MWLEYTVTRQNREAETEGGVESDFKHELLAFVSGHNIVVNDFEKLFHHLRDVLGAESITDLEELRSDDLSEDKTGKVVLPTY